MSHRNMAKASDLMFLGYIWKNLVMAIQVYWCYNGNREPEYECFIYLSLLCILRGTAVKSDFLGGLDGICKTSAMNVFLLIHQKQCQKA